MEVQGQDQVSGLPRPVNITTNDIVEALQEPMNELVTTTRRVLEKTPPELISDIIDRGVALCGGGALLRGVDKYLTKALGIPAYLVDNPPPARLKELPGQLGCVRRSGAACPRFRFQRLQIR